LFKPWQLQNGPRAVGRHSGTVQFRCRPAFFQPIANKGLTMPQDFTSEIVRKLLQISSMVLLVFGLRPWVLGLDRRALGLTSALNIAA
jgi:hypothetical protein